MNSTEIILRALDRYEAKYGPILSDTEIESRLQATDSTQSENKDSLSHQNQIEQIRQSLPDLNKGGDDG